jgi:hypothetical protein
MLGTFKIVKQMEPVELQSQKAEGGLITKSMLVLQELGGKYANTYVCATFGNTAPCRWTPGEIVMASLKFEAREHNGNFYQDIVANEIVSIKN